MQLYSERNTLFLKKEENEENEENYRLLNGNEVSAFNKIVALSFLNGMLLYCAPSNNFRKESKFCRFG